jgi:hypothetical protein
VFPGPGRMLFPPCFAGLNAVRMLFWFAILNRLLRPWFHGRTASERSNGDGNRVSLQGRKR